MSQLDYAVWQSLPPRHLRWPAWCTVLYDLPGKLPEAARHSWATFVDAILANPADGAAWWTLRPKLETAEHQEVARRTARRLGCDDIPEWLLALPLEEIARKRGLGVGKVAESLRDLFKRCQASPLRERLPPARDRVAAWARWYQSGRPLSTAEGVCFGLLAGHCGRFLSEAERDWAAKIEPEFCQKDFTEKDARRVCDAAVYLPIRVRPTIAEIKLVRAVENDAEAPYQSFPPTAVDVDCAGSPTLAYADAIAAIFRAADREESADVLGKLYSAIHAMRPKECYPIKSGLRKLMIRATEVHVWTPRDVVVNRRLQRAAQLTVGWYV